MSADLGLALPMAAMALLGSVMRSTGVVAMFIPVVMRIITRQWVGPAQLMMSMACAALISGKLTLIATSPNLVINQELVRQGAQELGVVAFTPFGVPVLLLAIVYLQFARCWLPAAADDELACSRPKLKKWVKRCQLAVRELRVWPGSPLLARPLGELAITDRLGVRPVLIERGEGSRGPPTRRRTPSSASRSWSC